MTAVRLTILGQPYSKSNRPQLFRNRKTRKPMIIKSDQARAYAGAVKMQAPIRRPLLEGDLRFTATLYYRDRRSDLDESIILDALQKRVYQNDRQIKAKHIYHAIDRKNPRAEIIIAPDDGRPKTGADFIIRAQEALAEIANGDGCYGAQAFEYKNIARAALGMPRVGGEA